MFSDVSITNLKLLSFFLLEVIESSQQWKMKRRLKETTTNCVITMISQNWEYNIFIIMWVEWESELHINDVLKLNYT